MDNFFSELITSFFNILRPVFSALIPLITGLALAYLLNPSVRWLESRFKSRSLAILATYLTAAAALCTILYAFIVLITGALPGDPEATIRLVKNYFSEATAAVSGFISDYLSQDVPDVSENASRHMHNWLISKLSLPSVVDAVSSFTGLLVNLFLGLVASVYLLKDKEFFIGLWEKFLVLIFSQRIHGIISEISGEINIVVSTFIKGALVDSIIVAFLSSLVLTLLDVNFSVIIGILAGFLNIIPYFGPFVSMIPAFFAAFFSGGLVHGLAAIGGLFAVQQLDANFIYPKIVGATTGLHPLFVLLSVSILGYLCGIAGMLLAVPCAGILQIFIRRWAYSK